VDQQLAELLGAPARQAGLTPTGPFNLGEDETDYRVPDRGLHRDWVDRIWYPTATLVVEIVSRGDETWEKLGFFAAHVVDEVLIVDPAKRKVDWLGLTSGRYQPIAVSGLIELAPGTLAARIDWP
jgi:Uma2 family endonuclease